MCTSLDWQSILKPLVVPTSEGLPLSSLLLFEFDEDSERAPALVLRASAANAHQESCLSLDEATILDLHRAEGAPLIIDTFHRSGNLEPLASFLHQHGYSTGFVAPLIYRERLLACLVGCSTQQCTFTPIELSIFSMLASNLAVRAENARLHDEIQRRCLESTSFKTISSALLEESSLETVLELIVDEAVRSTGASDALILLLDEEGEWFKVCARKGPGVAGLKNRRLLVKNSLNGLAVATGQPLVSEDAMTDRRANRDRAERLNVHTVTIAPLVIRQEVQGTLAVHNKQRGQFSRTDIDLLCSFANQAAIAIKNARLLRDLLNARNENQRKAQEFQELLTRTVCIQEDERRRIAAELHDRVIPLIVGAIYEVEACSHLGKGSADVRGQLTLVKDLLNKAVEETRTSIFDLWPVVLDQTGLLPALNELLRCQEKRTGIRYALRTYGSPFEFELWPTARIAVYRIVQEALNNVLKHASATSVEVLVRFSPQGLRITIRDDGRGFNSEGVMLSCSPGHCGLASMRERALEVGGKLTVASVPGRGSQVILQVPINGAAAEKKDVWENATYSRSTG